MIAFAATATTLALVLAPAPLAPAPTAAERGARLADRMAADLTADDALRHLDAFQAIADASGGHRAAGTPGHDRSARYAARVLAGAGLTVTFERFTFPYREALAESLALLPAEDGGAEREIPVHAMSYTGNTEAGGLTAPLVAITAHGSGGAGCAAEDFAGHELAGRVALLERGDCTFAAKQANAAAAGAAAVLVYNSEPGELTGTLGDPDPAALPTGGIAREDGLALAAALAEGTSPTVRLDLRELVEERETANVIAETPGGDPATTVVVGAHLDSVPDGPGINDNASGAAGVLAAALALDEAGGAEDPPHRVRFALWSAEELGLRGARHHVDHLSPAEREAIGLYLNFDMIGSPNPGLFVYEGADLDARSAAVTEDLSRLLDEGAGTARPIPFDGRSDYAPFLDAGIPVGGTFAGAEGRMTEEEAALWGGTAGEPHDPCYHRACDTVSNIDRAGLAAHTRALARAVGRYAWHLPDRAEAPDQP
ncbi:M20/M25/M40 family metallo-hydrolase [Streptomyces triticirhizae]|uniref:M20/M25/M40 family metallo-hydrolase n=1 Tax=Streptomyces triticirhizae TaxID=2483353 RepID=A0A3M2LQQ0_9ACTN|nr:M20/M25/M40 family metallo-hydrolase [Streptomyces triticirhizae]RMI39811.1 M20/M25/M40 family metallo-hydrolase [Streptomyces triticirhizae]